MNPDQIRTLRRYYAALSDGKILKAWMRGPESYQPGAWEVVADEFRSRGLDAEPPPILSRRPPDRS